MVANSAYVAAVQQTTLGGKLVSFVIPSIVRIVTYLGYLDVKVPPVGCENEVSMNSHFPSFQFSAGRALPAPSPDSVGGGYVPQSFTWWGLRPSVFRR